MSYGTRVSLSSVESFYIEAPVPQVAEKLTGGALVQVGSRWVNPFQITQLTRCEIPSIESPERLD